MEKRQQDGPGSAAYPSPTMSKPETVTIKLEHPFNANGAPVSEITLRRPTVQDAINAKKGNVSDEESEMRLLANLAGVAPDDFMQMDLADFTEVQGVARGFLSRKKAGSAKP